MNRDDDFALHLAEWLEDGPFVAPSRGVEAAIDHARTHPRSPIPWPFAMRLRRITDALPDTRLAWLVAALIALLLLGAALAAGSRYLAVAAPTCPGGTTPDEAGPRGQLRPPVAQAVGALAWDDRSGRLVLLAREATGDTPTVGGIWTFDVCTNRWRQELAGATVPDRGPVVYDEDSALTVAIGDAGVWTYDLAQNRWARMASVPPGWIWDAIYDPVSGLLIGHENTTGRLWTYDVEADSWSEIDQGGDVPAAAGGSGFQLLGFDRAADWLVLTTESGTWLFDPRVGIWTRGGTRGPVDFFIGGRQIAYDEKRGQILVYGAGAVTAYDSRPKAWRVLAGDPAGGGSGVRLGNLSAGYAMAYDPLNDRLVVVGGGRQDEAEGWVATDGVIAFDLETHEWIELLAPSEG